MRGPILYFFLLKLGILFNLDLDVGHKQVRFSQTLLNKSFEFILSKVGGLIAFNLSLVLLSAEINLISEKQSHKKDVLVACGTSYIKIVFTLLTKVIVLYM